MTSPAKKPTQRKTEPKPDQRPLSPRFAVVVICLDEAEQKRIYDTMCAAGHRCKVLTSVGT